MPNPYVVSLDREEVRYKTYYRRGSGTPQHHWTPRPREGHRRVYVPRREEVVETLAQHGMLPAIYFVFSRAGCDRSVEWLMGSGIRLTSQDEAERIRDFTEMRAAWMDEDDLRTLGFYAFGEALAAGISAHHAGMLPVSARRSRSCSRRGWSRSCSPPRPSPWHQHARLIRRDRGSVEVSGERHEILTPGEYTQLTGRAVVGDRRPRHAVVVYQRQVPFERVASLASTRTYELTSPFRPYNMAVNLVRNYTREQAHHLPNSSFAQFLADRGWSPSIELERSAEALEGYRRQMHCHLDFREYWRLREKATSVREEARKGRERPGRTRSGRRCRRFVPGTSSSSRGPNAAGSRWSCRSAREADGARAGPEVPPVGARLRGRARRPDEGAVAQIGVSQRAIPP